MFCSYLNPFNFIVCEHELFWQQLFAYIENQMTFQQNYYAGPIIVCILRYCSFSSNILILICCTCKSCLWMIAMMTPIRTVSEGDNFCCIPSDYTKTEYGFWANLAVPLKNPINVLPFAINLIYVITFAAFLVPTLLLYYWHCPYLFPSTVLSSVFSSGSCLFFMFAVRTPTRMVS